MLTECLHYELPESLIAQQPCPIRDESRLMVVNRSSGDIVMDSFRNIALYFRAGDCLTLNDTRVIRARLRGHKGSGGSVEVFLLKELSPGNWSALVRPSSRVSPGTYIRFASGVNAVVEERLPHGKRKVRFEEKDVIRQLEEAGEIPLPPYIHRHPDDPWDGQRYQTVYAAHAGAVAAPTAGLHYTEAIFNALKATDVAKCFLTLHVGYGTFKPITAPTLEDHSVDEEIFDFPENTARILNEKRAHGGRIIAVGTTCARVLESQYRAGQYCSGSGATSLYIYPPYSFQAVDILQTNFHLPKSSLLALVCAFGGYELIMSAYHQAIREKFRFYSYGDAMLIL